MHLAPHALARTCANTGKRIEAKIAMIAITTSSSIRVKPLDSPVRFMAFPFISMSAATAVALILFTIQRATISGAIDTVEITSGGAADS